MTQLQLWEDNHAEILQLVAYLAAQTLAAPEQGDSSCSECGVPTQWPGMCGDCEIDAARAMECIEDAERDEWLEAQDARQWDDEEESDTDPQEFK